MSSKPPSDGRRLTTLQYERKLESYLLSNAPPRWMERLMQIENGVKRVRLELGERYEALRAADPEGFAERWRGIARRERFDELNTLIEQHNTWFPMERDLPMNPRTGKYVYMDGRDFKREPLTPEWILREFPAD